LRAEREQIISEVLGRDYVASEAELQDRRESREQQRAWLPAEKRGQLAALEEKRQQRLAEWAQSLGSRPDHGPTAEDNARMQVIQQEFEAAENELLTHDELDLLRLRESDAANWAASLPGFEPTEVEWQAVARLRSDYDQAQRDLALADLSDEERQVRQADLEAHLASDTKNALGADRYAQFELAGNGVFQEIRNITQRYGLPDSVAQQAYEAQQAALAQAGEARSLPGVSPEDLQAALAAIQRQARQTLAQTLGENVFATYQEYSGDWLQGLVPSE
jgi:hypothetical protein